MSKIELHENESIDTNNYYSQILENSNDVIYVIEVTNEGRFIHKEINNTFVHETGIPRDEIIGRYVDEMQDKEFKDILIEKYSSCIQAGAKTDYINEYNFPSGRKIFHSVLTPIYDDNGVIYQIVGIARDITKQKQNEKHLVKSETAFRTLVENHPDIVIRFDSTCQYIYVNPAFEKISQYKKDELLGKTPVESSPFIAPKYFMNELNKVMQTQSPSEFEMVIYSHEGDISWHVVSLVPEIDEQGAIGVLCVGHDITHAKQYESMLQKSSHLEQQMSQIASNLPGFIFTLNKSHEGHLSMPYVSSGITTLLGIHPEKLSKDITPFYKLIHPDDLQKLKKAISISAFEFAPFSEEFRVLETRQEERWIEAKALPQIDHDDYGSILWHGMMLDITERKKNEILYQSKSDLIRSLVESSPDIAIFALDTAYNYLSFNTKHKEVIAHLWGKEIDIGMNMLELITLDSDREMAKLSFDRALSGESFNIESIYGDNELSKKVWHIFFAPIHSHTSEIIGVTCFNIDITEHRKTETILQQMEAKYSLLFQESQMAISLFSLERFVFLEVNKSHILHTGYTREEIIEQQGIDIWVDKTQRDTFLSEVQLMGKVENFEFLYRKKDATVGVASTHGTLLELNGEWCILAETVDITERKQQEEALAQKEKEFRTLAENSPDTIARYDKDYIRFYANPAFITLSGLSIDELVGKTPTATNNSKQAMQYEKIIKYVFETGIKSELEYTWQNKAGRFITSHIHIIPEIDSNGNVSSILAIGRDITSIRENESRLKEAQILAKVGSWELEFPGLQLFWSQEVYNIFEISPDEYEPSYDHFLNLIHPEDRELVDAAYSESLNNKTHYDIVHRLLFPDGRIKYVHERGHTIYDENGTILRSIGSIQDITERKTVENSMEHMAHHDTLTGLPNRLIAQKKTEEAIKFAKKNHSKVALLFLDLDGFKIINDSLGHSIGDEMIRMVASRLKECVYENSTISRHGGDEFLIILPNIHDKKEVHKIIEKLLSKFEHPFDIKGHFLTTSASIGVALYPDSSNSFDSLLRNADTAMYKAKENGKNTYCFYNIHMFHNLIGKIQVQNDLKKAITNKEFVLHYQPQIDLKLNQITGAEALIRWRHPQLGMIPPMDFIPMAESSGLIIPIGEWVIMEACKQAALWAKKGIELTIAVNISAVQFKRGNLEEIVRNALNASGLKPQFLELELTETIMIHDAEKILKSVQLLKDIGVQLSIDDFGTGYSSLAYLKRFAVDKLKIDQSFVRDLLIDNEDAVIVNAIIQMAKNLNLKTIAEGVENQDVLDVIHTLGCDEVQGYHFAKPMESSEFEKYQKAFIS